MWPSPVACSFSPSGRATSSSYCAKLTAESAPQAALVDLFPDPEQALDDYDHGRFVYVPYRASGYGDWWGEACVSRAYAEREWPSRGFEFLDFVEDPQRFKQHLWGTPRP